MGVVSTPRILVRQIPSKPPYCILACYTEETFLNDRNSMNIINIKCNPLCLLGILNSRAISFGLSINLENYREGCSRNLKLMS